MLLYFSQTEVVHDDYEKTITDLNYGTSYNIRVVGIYVVQEISIESPPGEASGETSNVT